LCRFRDELPDRFRSSEYYRQYCERTHLLDEMDYLMQVSGRTTVVLVVGRRNRMFNKAELQRLGVIEPVVQSAIRKTWDEWVAKAGNPRGDEGRLWFTSGTCLENSASARNTSCFRC
jgi:hypothetical protein